MLVDAHELEKTHTVETDVCIIGAGPAGTALARVLGEKKINTCVLAGGTTHEDPEAQQLYAVETKGDPYLPPVENRRRQFGGTSNLWSIKVGDPRPHVRYALLKEIDFEERPWIPHSGWPIKRADLMPYYTKAHDMIDAGPIDYNLDHYTDAQHQPLPIDSNLFTTEIFRFGPGAAYYDAGWNGLQTASSVQVLLNAHAVDFATTETSGEGAGSRRVQQLLAKTFKGHEIQVKARVFVIAAGGIESPRLLMAANDGQGLGTSPVLGQYYTDHPLVNAGDFIPTDAELFERMGLYDTRKVQDIPAMGRLDVSPEAQKAHGVLNSCVSFFPRPSMERADAVRAAKEIYVSAKAKKVPDNLAESAQKIIKNTDYIATIAWDKIVHDLAVDPGFGRGGWSERAKPWNRFSRYELYFFCEQAPDPSNRLELTSERDSLGMRRVQLNWGWTELDVSSVRRTQGLLKEALEGTGLGKFEYKPFEREDGCTIPQGLAHHMGATRMSATPDKGVVDADCKVHGVDNLFVSSSSVFPTGGFSNPTLTIVAMALRLADHISNTAETA